MMLIPTFFMAKLGFVFSKLVMLLILYENPAINSKFVVCSHHLTPISFDTRINNINPKSMDCS